MSARATTTIMCPICRKRATVTLSWTEENDTMHAEVADYECPTGCQVDAESIREIIGAQ
jgi:post-segregation antitoxin (ccd killing protein)